MEAEALHVLILSVTTGGGHNSAAAAAARELEAAGHRVTVADLYGVCGVPVSLPDLIYRFCAVRLPRRYSRVFTRMCGDPAFRREREKLFLPSWLYPRLLDYLLRLEPDCVLAMHVFAARALSVLRQRGKLDVPVLGVLTDYCLHPYWEDCSPLEGLAAPHDSLIPEIRSRGMTGVPVHPIGIPTREPERRAISREEARRRLGLPEGPLILLMGGSMGYGCMFSTALALRRKGLPAVCVCGRNRLLHLLLRPFQSPALRVLGYTRELPEYMAAADLAVTKPGGLTMAELAEAGLPALLTRPIPGHEERNLRHWTESGACAAQTERGARAGRKTADAAEALLADPETLSRMRERMLAMGTPEAAKNLRKLTVSLDKAAKHDIV